MTKNPILDTDSYKSSHFLQYPPDTMYLFSYIESRGGLYDATKFIGLQPILDRLERKVLQEHVLEAAEFFNLHGEPFPREGWQRIVDIHDGHIPLRIRAVREGLVIPTHHPLVTVTNTDPELPWLVSWFETMLLRVWYPTTVATTSAVAREIILDTLERSSDDPDSEIDFKLHDFGSRGVSSYESAGIGGFAHLTNFKGTDTVPAILHAREHYGAEMAGFSIPATEHSTITSWGRENEVDAYSNLLDQLAKPGQVVACVSDSYDLYNAVSNLWGETLRSKIVESGATVVIRPDSGEPTEVVLRTLELLDEKFGHTINSKGYKVLNHVRVIQGDGINLDSITAISNAFLEAGFSATNVAYGMGGALLQQVNRDTQRFAYKCSAAYVAESWRDVYKDPITDPGKTSKRGILDLIEGPDGYTTVVTPTLAPHPRSVMHTVFENGKVTKRWTLEDIRELL